MRKIGILIVFRNTPHVIRFALQQQNICQYLPLVSRPALVIIMPVSIICLKTVATRHKAHFLEFLKKEKEGKMDLFRKIYRPKSDSPG